MAYQFIYPTRLQNGVATITLNRPEVYNALNDEITYELQDAWKAVAKDQAVRAVVITGAGGHSARAGPEGRLGRQELFVHAVPASDTTRLSAPCVRCLKPIVCRLNGVGAGAGCSMGLACDIIVASEEATLIEVFVNIGLVPDSVHLISPAVGRYGPRHLSCAPWATRWRLLKHLPWVW